MTYALQQLWQFIWSTLFPLPRPHNCFREHKEPSHGMPEGIIIPYGIPDGVTKHNMGSSGNKPQTAIHGPYGATSCKADNLGNL